MDRVACAARLRVARGHADGARRARRQRRAVCEAREAQAGRMPGNTRRSATDSPSSGQQQPDPQTTGAGRTPVCLRGRPRPGPVLGRAARCGPAASRVVREAREAQAGRMPGNAGRSPTGSPSSGQQQPDPQTTGAGRTPVCLSGRPRPGPVLGRAARCGPADVR
ncbi:hypothetical protein GCM10017779_54080 [Streptomyces capillispiralis]|nr:hypothetical protein GCM10017779_54080 [Streptomyces capillispiralis]